MGYSHVNKMLLVQNIICHDKDPDIWDTVALTKCYLLLSNYSNV